MIIKPVDFKNANASKDFTDSLKYSGFAVLENTPLDFNLIDDIYTEWNEFFRSGKADNYYFDKELQDGFFPSDISEIAKDTMIRDIKEFYHLYFPRGRFPKEVSTQVFKYFLEAFKLGQTLINWIEEHMSSDVKTNLKAKLSSTLDAETSLLRVLRYPYTTGDEEHGSIRAAAHEDINLVTVLPAGSESGLELLSKDDNKWYPVPCKKGQVVINIGDMLQEMTNFEYISTTHRVNNPEADSQHKDRMSMPLFLHPSGGTYLSEKYPKAKEYLDERLKELGIK